MFCPCPRRSRAKSASSSSGGSGSTVITSTHHPHHPVAARGQSFDSPAAAERLADYRWLTWMIVPGCHQRCFTCSRESPVPGSPETDSGSESLKLSLGTTLSSGAMPEANTSQDSHLAALTNSFKVCRRHHRVKQYFPQDPEQDEHSSTYCCYDVRYTLSSLEFCYLNVCHLRIDVFSRIR